MGYLTHHVYNFGLGCTTSKEPWSRKAAIMADSEKRRKNPLDFFIEFLEAIWMDNTEEEAIYQCEVKVKHFLWYASDALYCIEAVIGNPPGDLIDLLENHGWIGLYDETPDEIKPYSFDDTLNWLKKMHDKFRMIYEKGTRSMTG